MSEIRFYHLQRQNLEAALGALLAKALETGRRAVVRVPDAQAAARLNEGLWTFRADSFVPHGTKAEGHADLQPVWLTEADENPNRADMLVLTGGEGAEMAGAFPLSCDLFDGRDEEAVRAARRRWKTFREAGFDLTYWQQGERGGWEKKAEHRAGSEWTPAT